MEETIMKPLIKSFKKKEIFVDRESLHRAIRNMINEQNMVDENGKFLEIVEDLYGAVKTMDAMIELLSDALKANQIGSSELMLMCDARNEADKKLEKWERMILEA